MSFTIKKDLTTKKIFAQDDFISFTRFLLVAPFFTVTNSEDTKFEILTNYFGYDVTIDAMPLNVNIDQDMALFLVKNRFERDSLTFKVKLSDFYNFVNPEKTDMSNRNATYKKRIEESLKRIKSINLTVRNATQTFFCSFLNSAFIDYEKNELVVELNSMFDNFFKLDSNAIYNINRNITRRIKSDHAKILYNLYLCHSANKDKNFITVDVLKERFMFVATNDEKKDKAAINKLMMNVRKANKELKDLDILLVNTEVKAGDGRTTTGFNVLLTKTVPKSNSAMLPEVKPLKTEVVADDFQKWLQKTGRS